MLKKNILVDSFLKDTRAHVCMNIMCKFNAMNRIYTFDQGIYCCLKEIEIDKDGKCKFMESIINKTTTDANTEA